VMRSRTAGGSIIGGVWSIARRYPRYNAAIPSQEG
jgi:hypothetical protein